MQFKDIEVTKDHMKKVVKNIEYNSVIYDYYQRLLMNVDDIKVEKVLKQAKRLEDCNRFWLLDRYDKARIKDFKKTNLCNDKFCNNCKKVKQAQRMAKFIPLIRPYRKDMYQITLTVPNVKGDNLKETIEGMFKSFGTLIRYMKGAKKIKGIDFEKWGFEGAIRSLEITFNNDEYHPHLHALFVLKGDMNSSKHIMNTYSHDRYNKEVKRLFTDEEVLIQKIWKLLNTGKTVTKKAVESMKLGYSCTIDKFDEDDFLELFKYMTKSTSEDNSILTYEQFETLYYTLFKTRQIQGYGCFYGLKDEDKISIEEVNEAYDGLIESLKKEENPVEIAESPTELMKDKSYKIISRKKVGAFLRRLNK
ncbi:protein rep [Bacillus wiedmannii]|uniref:protein rep n=1 Tax=Bacillus wiedmannii TaxID=1890302 RepID=UPI0024ADCB72|nr:protein rep [Bacillus wiedmannii]MDI6680311.1 protein rep [Bacillus wiedmannii]